jgi:hypothetical protein
VTETPQDDRALRPLQISSGFLHHSVPGPGRVLKNKLTQFSLGELIEIQVWQVGMRVVKNEDTRVSVL